MSCRETCRVVIERSDSGGVIVQNEVPVAVDCQQYISVHDTAPSKVSKVLLGDASWTADFAINCSELAFAPG